MKHTLPFGATVIEYHPEHHQAFLDWLARPRPYLAVDTETTGIEWGDTVRLVQFGDADTAWVLRADRDRAVIAQVLQTYRRFIAWNAAFDTAKLHALTGVGILDRTSDTATLAGILDPRGDYQGGVGRGLKQWAAHVIGQKAGQPEADRKALWRKHDWKESAGWTEVPVDHPVYLRYAGADPILTYRVHQALASRVRDRANVVRREQQVMRTVASVQATGFLLSAGYTEALRRVNAEELAATMALLAPLGVTSLGSTKQIAGRLADEGLEDLIEYTLLHNPSVPKAVLKRAQRAGSNVGAMVLHAKKAKRISRDLCEAYLAAAACDGRVHPGLRPIGAKTRRMSCSSPNLQSVPKEKDTDTPVRGCFIPEPGHLLLSADFDQMELRYAAHISGDPRLLADIQANRDIFQQLAEQTWPGQGHRMRDVVKIAVYATLYGAGLSLVTGMLGLTRHEAELFRNGLAARYPVLWTTMRQVQETVAVTGGVILPRSGWLPTRADKPHVAFNLLVQGGCRDTFGERLLALDQAGLTPMLRMLIHDEVVLSVPREDVDNVTHTLCARMPITTEDGLHIPVSIKAGTSWGHLCEHPDPSPAGLAP